MRRTGDQDESKKVRGDDSGVEDHGAFGLRRMRSGRRERKAAKWTTQPPELFGGPDKTEDPAHQKKVVDKLKADIAKREGKPLKSPPVIKHSGNGTGTMDVAHTEYEGPSLLEQLAYVVEGASNDTKRRSRIVKGKAKRAGPPLKAGEAVEDYKWNEAAGRWEHVTPGVAKAVEGWHVKNRANPWLPPKQQKPS